MELLTALFKQLDDGLITVTDFVTHCTKHGWVVSSIERGSASLCRDVGGDVEWLDILV